LDRLDAKILNAVQKDNMMTLEILGDTVGLSATACQRRLRQLTKDGVIAANVSVVAPEKVGRGITIIVEITLERRNTGYTDIFKKEMMKNNDVMQCYYVAGDSDFVVILTAPDLEYYERFTRETFYANANVKKFKSIVVLGRVKVGLKVPIEFRDECGLIAKDRFPVSPVT